MNEPQGNQPQTGIDVTVSIDGKEKTIDRGSHLITALKALLGVNADYALSEDIDGILTPLTDDQRTTITGGEVFFSGARNGGAS